MDQKLAYHFAIQAPYDALVLFTEKKLYWYRYEWTRKEVIEIGKI